MIFFMVNARPRENIFFQNAAARDEAYEILIVLRFEFS